MATEIDPLQIEINASATKANDAIDKLVKKLDILSDSLSKINSSGLSGLASGVDRLGTAMQSMKNIRSNEFTRLANNIERLSKVDVSSLNNTANTISNLTNAFSGIGAISNNSQQLGILSTNLSTLARGIRSFGNINSSNLSSITATLTPLANGITVLGNVNFNNRNLQNLINSLTRLSNANVSGLSNVNFSQLGNSISQLATSLQNAPNIHQSIISMTNAISNLSESGQNISVVSANLGSLGNSLRRFMSDMALAPSISDNTISFSQAIGILANVGDRVGTTATNLPSLANALRNLMVTLSTAPNVSQNVIDLTNALANLASQGGRVGSASNSISRGLNRASTSATRAKKSFGGLASAIGKFYATFFMVIRGLKGLWSSIESTSDYIEAYNYFDVALGKIGKDWGHQYEEYGYDNAEDYAKSFSTRLQEKLKTLSGVSIEIDAEGKGLLSETGLKNLGLNIQEVTQYASQLASVTNSVGLTGEASLAASNVFTKLGADMSSLFNVDYSSVMNNLQSGLIGQSRALYKYGIDITNATLQTYAYELGLSKAVSEMTQAEKMQLRMIAILDQSKVSWGDLANTINSPSNMIRQFTNNIKEAGMILGQLFIPLLQKVLPIINGVVIAIKRLLVSIAEFFGIKIDLGSFGQGYSDLEEDIGGVSDSLDNVASSAKKAKAGLRAFDELKTINMPDTSSSNSGIPGGSGIDLTDEILNATSEYEKVWQEAYDRMEDVAGQWADKIEKTFKNIWKAIEPFRTSLVDLWNNGLDKFGTFSLTGLKDFYNEFLLPIGKWAFGTEDSGLTRFVDIINEKMMRIDWERLNESLKNFWVAIEPYAEQFGEGLIDFFEKISGLAVDAINKIPDLLDKFTKILNGGDPEKAREWGESLGKVAIALFAFKGLVSVIATISKIGIALKSLKEGLTFIGGGFKGIFETLKSLSGTGGILAGLGAAWKSFGGLGGLLTTDLATVVGAGTLTEIGLTIGTGIIGGIIAAVGGFIGGKFLGDLFTTEEFDDYYKNFKFFGDGGFFNEITDDFGTTITALDEMSTDIKNNKFVQFLSGDIYGLLGGEHKTLSEHIENFKSSFNELKNAVGVVGDFISGKIENVKLTFEGIIDFVTGVFSGDWNKAWDGICSIFESAMSNILFFTKDKADGIIEKFKELPDKAKNAFENLKENVTVTITDLMIKVQENVNKIKSFFGVENWSLSGIKDGLVSSFEGAIEGVKEIWNTFANFLNSKLTWTIDTIKNPITGGTLVKGFTIDLGKIPTFATGGFPEDGLFYANHTELVGKFSGGKTAVANNTQIIEGIANGVRSANAEQNKILMEQNTLLRALLEKETGISSDALFKSVKQSASDYSKRTGRPAFSN